MYDRANLVPILARLTREQYRKLHLVARQTKIPQAVLLRDAVEELLRKYDGAIERAEAS